MHLHFNHDIYLHPNEVRPSKCSKFYKERIKGELNLHQRVCNYFQNLNRDKRTYLFKYTLTVQLITLIIAT